jgi:hypothetical protein
VANGLAEVRSMLNSIWSALSHAAVPISFRAPKGVFEKVEHPTKGPTAEQFTYPSAALDGLCTGIRASRSPLIALKPGMPRLWHD